MKILTKPFRVLAKDGIILARHENCEPGNVTTVPEGITFAEADTAAEIDTFIVSEGLVEATLTPQ